jgi:glucokinase
VRVLAVDIGGTKVALAIVTEDGSVLASERLPTPRIAPRAAVAEILERAATLAGPARVAAGGIVLPAVVEEGRIAWAAESIAGWDGLPLASLASEAVGVPFAVEFDGYGATLGELWQGCARGYQDAVIVIVGTGIGAGFVHNGQLVRGKSGVAGGIGWFRCPRGEILGPTLEELAAGPAILTAARELDPATGYPDTEAVFRAAQGGNPAAASVVQRALLALSAGIGSVVALLAPEIVVLGGSVGARADVVDAVRRHLGGTTQPFAARSIRVEPSALGPYSSLYGAAYLAHQLAQGKEP